MHDPNVALDRQLTWWLDHLGNWTGYWSPAGLARNDDFDGDGDLDATQAITHAVDHANQLETVTVTENGGDPATQTMIHDAAGNLVWDGRLFYQYDGFNRLVQVNEASRLDPNFYPFINGKLYYYPDDPPPVGPTLATFIYDGLGRLIQTKRFDQQGHTQVEEYYYDGVRRILEIEITDPNTPSAVTAYREYVYGPGYVDEVICQIAASGAGTSVPPETPPATYFYLQDGNYNVTAVLGPPDPNAITGPGASPAVLWQYTYEPYGQLVFAECGTGVSPVVLPVNRLGHQGLFFERFCVDPNDSVTAPALLPDDPATGRKVVGLYNNRNRWYSPELGRFVQKDMNETAMPIITVLVMNGHAPSTILDALNGESNYADGMNLYSYNQTNPVNRSDPIGCFTFLEELLVEEITYTLHDQTVDNGRAFLVPIRGLGAFLSYRNQQLDQITGADFGSVDTRLVDYALDNYQKLQYIQCGFASVGVLKAGATVARRGLGGLATLLKKGAGVLSDRHHVFAKFLGGWSNGLKRRLPAVLHKEYHRWLRQALRGVGIDLPENAGSRAWQRFMRNELNAQAARNALLRCTEDFDRARGFNLLPDLLEQMRRQGL